MNGHMVLTLVDPTNNTWVSSHHAAASSSSASVGGGTKSLSGTLTQLRIKNITANTFDAGAVNVLLE